MKPGRVAVFGATGPVGRRVVRGLLDRGLPVRVVSRSEEKLDRDFGTLDVERRPADLEAPEQAARAAAGCELLVHAVGVPAQAYEKHLPIARNAVAAAATAGARTLLVTSFWSYGPGSDAPMAESRAPSGDSRMAAIRARQEEIFLGAGGAVARLPDFYGPEPGVSLLNDALRALARGKAVMWPGDPDAPRDFLYYGDVGRLLVDLALREEAYGHPWNVPGSGALPPRQILSRAAHLAGRPLRLRRVRRWQARLAAAFRSDIRDFLDVMPLYESPMILDATRLRSLLGDPRTTPYPEALAATLSWMEAAGAGAGATGPRRAASTR